jgi:Ca2+-transporting ATPase
MDHPPRRMDEPVLDRAQWIRIIVTGAILAAATLLILDWADTEIGATTAATMALTAFGLMEIGVGLGARSELGTVFDRDVVGGRRQLMLFGLSFLLIVLASELGVLQRLLDTTPLTGGQWLVCLAAAGALVLIDEGIKWALRSRRLTQ